MGYSKAQTKRKPGEPKLKIDIEADQFARCLLMPAEWVIDDFINFDSKRHLNILAYFSERYKVDEVQCALRLNELNLV